jgi:hypothetical protein
MACSPSAQGYALPICTASVIMIGQAHNDNVPSHHESIEGPFLGGTRVPVPRACLVTPSLLRVSPCWRGYTTEAQCLQRRPYGGARLLPPHLLQQERHGSAWRKRRASVPTRFALHRPRRHGKDPTKLPCHILRHGAGVQEASYAKLVWTSHRLGACWRSAAGRPGHAR